jgi:hypothetical protein
MLQIPAIALLLAVATAFPTPPQSHSDSAGKNRAFVDQPVSVESSKRQKVEEVEGQAEVKVSEGRGAPNYSRGKTVETLNIAAERYKAHTGAQEAEEEYDQNLEEARVSRARTERLAALYAPRDHKSSLADDVDEPNEGTKLHAPDEIPYSAEIRQPTVLSPENLADESPFPVDFYLLLEYLTELTNGC